MSHKRTHHAMSRNRYRCHTREHNFMQCPERYTNVTQENTASCNVQNQVQMSHKRAQLHAMSRNRHHVLPDATQENTTSCNVQKQTLCHTKELNVMQCPESDTDVTQENTSLCNVENQTQMSHKRTQLHAMSRIRHRCHTREHNFMQCPESQLNAMSRIRHRCHTREHNFMQCPE